MMHSLTQAEMVALRTLYSEQLATMGPAAARAGSIYPDGIKVLLRNVRSQYYLCVPGAKLTRPAQCDTAAVTSRFIWEHGPVGTVLLKNASCGRYIHVAPDAKSATSQTSLSSTADEGSQFTIEKVPAGLMFKSVR
jgi:hypothetical protein